MRGTSWDLCHRVPPGVVNRLDITLSGFAKIRRPFDCTSEWHNAHAQCATLCHFVGQRESAIVRACRNTDAGQESGDKSPPVARPMSSENRKSLTLALGVDTTKPWDDDLQNARRPIEWRANASPSACA